MVELAKEENREEMWMSALEVALPLYTRALFTTLETCVAHVKAGAKLPSTAKGKSAAWVKFAAEAALRAGKVADDALMADPEQLLDIGFEGLDDFSLATLAQVLFERDPGRKNDALSEQMRARQSAAYLRILYSEQGHPLVDYAWMAQDFINDYMATDETDEIDVLKRCLAHTRRYGKESDVLSMLQRIGTWHIENRNIEEGCRVFGELIASDPLDFENYYSAGLELFTAKHYDLALKVADRAHHMLRISRTDHEMAGHLACCVGDSNHYLHSETAIFDKPAEAPLRKALETGFMRGTHLSTEELVQRIVPEIDQIPVKEIPHL